MMLPDGRSVPALQSGGAHRRGLAGGIGFFGGPEYPANQIVGLGLYGEVTAAASTRWKNSSAAADVPSTVVVSPLADASLRALMGGAATASRSSTPC